MEIFEGIEVTIREKEVLRLLGYKEARQRLKGELRGILEDELQEGYSLIKAKAIYEQVKIKEMGEKSIRLANNLVLNTGDATKAWKEANYLGVGLCTIGSALEERVSELFTQKEHASAVILDSIGSAAVDSVADYVNYVVCERENRLGISVGPRLSPGYGKWELADQRTLFALIPSEMIDVHLNKQYMMIPRKSVSFCIGIGEALSTAGRINPCRHCNMKACPYQREEPK